MTTDDTPHVRPQLGLWDAVSIIVGIVVGTTIFRGTGGVFNNAGSPATTLLLWLAGGALAWSGAVCYAELATAYPRDGGDYEYLNRGFGRWCGFLFAWAQITTVISGNIAIMAYAFADYAGHLWPGAARHTVWLTVAPIFVLSALNCIGIVAGKATQNMLTATKVVGLAAIVIAGLSVATPQQPPVDTAASATRTATPNAPPNANLGLALVFVLYAFGGWTHAAYVAAEVRDQRRNLPRALTFGIVGITLIYLIVNVAYLHALGYDAARHAATPAADVLERAVGPWGGGAISVLVMLSALGAINGMILTGTRIYAVWGDDYPALGWLSVWNRHGAPVVAIVLQAIVAAVLVVIVGSETGRNTFDAALGALHIASPDWEFFDGGFNTLVAGTSPVYWGLCLLTVLTVFILRRSDPQTPRPFTMPLYPLPAILFCATCVFMLHNSIKYAGGLTLLGLAPLALGGLLFVTLRKKELPMTKSK